MTEIAAAGRLSNEVLRKFADGRLLLAPSAGLCAVVIQRGNVHGYPAAEKILEIVRAEVAAAGDDGAAALVAALGRANAWLVSESQTNLGALGTIACVAAALFRQGHVHIAHLGTARVYRWRRGALEQLTRDHTLAEAPEALMKALADLGSPDPEMVNVVGRCITRALGVAGVEPSIASHALEQGDRFVLCSIDNSALGADDLAAALAGHADAARVCDHLMDLARARGAATDEGMRLHVNTAIVVVDVKLP